ncbi:hypothetical protein DFH27DRAFT_193186 [Peziza echinospora]|nr:hypothetical protein DFH27DRAFT_193186 [Peziza echinospora]
MPPPAQEANIPAPAAAIYHLLSSLFNYIDDEIEPKNIGVVTMVKFRILIKQLAMEGDFTEALATTQEEQIAMYSDLECQYYLTPPFSPGGIHDYTFTEPTAVGLTKAGYIKLQAVSLILEGSEGMEGLQKDLEYRFLQRCIQLLPLYRIDPTTNSRITFAPLPPQDVVRWYVSSLATSLLGYTDASPLAVAQRYVTRMQARKAKIEQEQQQQKQYQEQQQEQQHGNGGASGSKSDEQFQREVDALRAQEQAQALNAMRTRMADAQLRRSAESSFMLGFI